MCIDVCTQSETLLHSLLCNRIPMWEMNQQLRGKANQRNALPVKNERLLNKGVYIMSSYIQRQQIKINTGQANKMGLAKLQHVHIN